MNGAVNPPRSLQSPPVPRPQRTLIDAQKARDFVRIVESLAQDNAYHSDEYQRGAGETCRMMRTYLDALLAEPESDRMVRYAS